MAGPSATAPKMHRFMIIAVVRSLLARVAERQRRHGRDQQQARAQALEHVARDVHPRDPGRRRQHRSDHQQRRIDDQHPSLRQVLGELDRQHRAGRVGGVGQA